MSKNESAISDEAVEAAAKMSQVLHFAEPWESLPDFLRRERLREARLTLEAAAPYMMAEAWDRCAASIVDEYGNPIIPDSNTNPYRSQA